MFSSRTYEHHRLFERIFSILLASINPSHQCSQHSRQQFSSPKCLSTVTSLSRVWNYYSVDSLQNGHSLRRFASYCPLLVRPMRAPTDKHACQSRSTLATSLLSRQYLSDLKIITPSSYPLGTVRPLYRTGVSLLSRERFLCI